MKIYTPTLVKCATRGCYNAATKGKYCAKCHSRRYREKHPVKAAYYALKHNAKRRGKEFNLTFEQFKQFAVKTGYMKKKGTTAYAYHIDRIDENKGYTIDNIQLLTNRDNVRKYFDYHWDEIKRQMVFNTRTVKAQAVSAPF